MDASEIRFPGGFLWGAATAAHQVEGDNRNSDWWRFEEAGGVARGQVSGKACDQYRRFAEDFALARELGHTAHRLSIEWARIEPEIGVFDEGEIAHYVEVLKALRHTGMRSFVTLHHFTNPVWLADLGGWASREAAALYERYVRRVIEPLAPYVDFWIPVNEARVLAMMGYVWGTWPPQRRREFLAARRVIVNLAEGHRRAYAAIHEAVPDAQVGSAHILEDRQPLSRRNPLHRISVAVRAHYANWFFGDLVKEHQDFMGVHYYHSMLTGIRTLPFGRRGVPQSDMGWDIVPEGFERVVMAAWRRYGLPIYITENGVADADDRLRPAFIRDHLASLARAIERGADVRGYLHWSLLDNFEWAEGFDARFGLVAVDFETQARTPRPSAFLYRDICERNGFMEYLASGRERSGEVTPPRSVDR